MQTTKQQNNLSEAQKALMQSLWRLKTVIPRNAYRTLKGQILANDLVAADNGIVKLRRKHLGY